MIGLRNHSGGHFINERALRSFEGDTVQYTLSLSPVMCIRASVCMQAAEWVRLANCHKAALLLAAVLASWQQINSRAGAVYVTWGRASEAFQQVACLSLWGDSACLSVLFVWLTLAICEASSSVCGPSFFSGTHLQVSSIFSTGGVVRESNRFVQDLETIRT